MHGETVKFISAQQKKKKKPYRFYSQVLKHYRKLQQFTLECTSVTLDGLVVGVIIMTTKISRPLPARF
jgi:ABC-type uncharacterized transport system fused permease/ATPase subunit